MVRFPFYCFPNPYYKNYRYYPNYNSKTYVNTSFNQFSNDKPGKEEILDENAYFEIMGLKLYIDDILLLSLLFFLYTEGVQDEGLFIALILLLLT